MSEIAKRRRAMMGEAEDQIAHMVPGTYLPTSGTNLTMELDANGVATSDSGRIFYFMTVPLDKPVYYKTGDVITLVQDRSYESFKGFRSLKLSGSETVQMFSNFRSLSYASPTYTFENDGYFDTLEWGNCSSYDYGPARPTFYINGALVIG